jgi:thioredoxin-like negative regulator of GroEL
MMEPVLLEIGKKFENRLKLVRLDIENERRRTQFYQIEALPTFIIIYKRMVLNKFIGFRDAVTFEKEIENVRHSAKWFRFYRILSLKKTLLKLNNSDPRVINSNTA